MARSCKFCVEFLPEFLNIFLTVELCNSLGVSESDGQPRDLGFRSKFRSILGFRSKPDQEGVSGFLLHLCPPIQLGYIMSTLTVQCLWEGQGWGRPTGHLPSFVFWMLTLLQLGFDLQSVDALSVRYGRYRSYWVQLKSLWEMRSLISDTGLCIGLA